jgi:hypothetical protein
LKRWLTFVGSCLGAGKQFLLCSSSIATTLKRQLRLNWPVAQA